MADIEKITKQVISLLNANSDEDGARVYSAESGDEDFLDGEIARGIEEAKKITAQKICDSDSGLKSPFKQQNVAITNEAKIPAHYGRISVKIVPFPDAAAIKAQRRSADEISSYRENPDGIYGANHNEADAQFADSEGVSGVKSDISGKYADDDGVFTFTGHTATIDYFADIDLEDYPDELETPITHIAVGLLAKDGSVSEKFAEHLNIGLGLLGDVVTQKDESR